MQPIHGPGRADGRVVSRSRAGTPRGGFVLPDARDAPAGVGAAAAAGAASPLALPDDAPEERDRRALAHGETLAEALERLRRALLGAGTATAALGDLERALANAATAAEPGLARIVGSIRLRARIELARRRPDG